MKTFILSLIVAFSLVIGSASARSIDADNLDFQAGIYAHTGKNVWVHINRQSASGVVISIKNSEGLVIFRQAVQAHQLVVKKYDLTAFPSGEYTVEVKHAENVVSQVVSLK